jgi:multicomponent Na+:H+ antiporter subunit D
MVELGIYAVARIYWVDFASVLGQFANPTRDVLLGVGTVTAVVGAVMCGMQRHLKRLLAYSTISHAGCFLIGVALLSPDALAGAAVYAIAHAFAKGALFLAGGILLVAKGEIDELRLRGYGRDLRAVGVAWLIGALALASPPFLGTFTGHALIDDAAGVQHYWWVPLVLAFATIGSTGAIARAGARVFLGIGDPEDPLLSDEPRESPPPRERPRVGLMTGVTLAMAAAGLAVGAITPLAARAMEAAHSFTDTTSYLAVVLDHHGAAPVEPEHWHTTASSVIWALVTLIGSFVVGFASLYRARLPKSVSDALAGFLHPLRAAHSGHIGDYIAWLTFGTAVIGGLFAISFR